MDELLKTDESGNQAVSARELHAALGVGKDFSTWIKDRIEKYGFMEGRDYERREDLSSPNLGNPKARPQTLINYLLTISTAKEIAMVENNEQGRKIRQYLIKVESAWNTPELVIMRGYQALQKKIESQRKQIVELEPKAAFFDQVADSKDAIDMREVAAVLNISGWGRNKIFAFLRERNILDDRNLPYRGYQDRGYFRVIEQKWTAGDGETRISLKTLVYQRGLDFIRGLIQRQAA